MAITIISFFNSTDKGLISQTELEYALKAVQVLVTAGARVEVRALDRTFLEVYHPLGEPSRIKLDDGDMPAAISAGAVTVWMPDDLDNIELATKQLMEKMHAALGAVGTCTFDTRRHLDLVGDGPTPTLQALAVVERRETMDRDGFIQYYRTHHVPLAKSLKPRFVRYTTFRLLEKLGDFVGDCVTLQEYPSLEDLRIHLTTRTSEGDTAGDDSAMFIAHLVYNIGERTLEAS